MLLWVTAIEEVIESGFKSFKKAGFLSTESAKADNPYITVFVASRPSEAIVAS